MFSPLGVYSVMWVWSYVWRLWQSGYMCEHYDVSTQYRRHLFPHMCITVLITIVINDTKILKYRIIQRTSDMVFNDSFNNISVIWWRPVLLVDEIAVPGENHALSQATEKLYYIMLYRVCLAWAGFELTSLVVKDTDCIGSCKSKCL